MRHEAWVGSFNEACNMDLQLQQGIAAWVSSFSKACNMDLQLRQGMQCGSAALTRHAAWVGSFDKACSLNWQAMCNAIRH